MEQTETNFEELSIFNQIKLKTYLGENLREGTDKIFLCGKMFSHTFQAKYSFRACDFYIYLPFNKMLFHSQMTSDDCFTSTLKWNYNFFKKIRMCLESVENIKSTYFAINYEKKNNTNSKNNIIIDINLNLNLNSNENKDNQEEELELDFSDKKIYLELHFVVDNQDIIAFRLLLKHIIDDKPHLTIMNKLLELDKEESEKLIIKQKKLYDKTKDLERMERDIRESEDNFLAFKKQSIYKLYYLNKEKNKKINELNNELKKEKRITNIFR
jgi:hypothetical protein